MKVSTLWMKVSTLWMKVSHFGWKCHTLDESLWRLWLKVTLLSKGFQPNANLGQFSQASSIENFIWHILIFTLSSKVFLDFHPKSHFRRVSLSSKVLTLPSKVFCSKGRAYIFSNLMCFQGEKSSFLWIMSY
jgi:hypothetical protein